jgi:hypothetical protein
MTGYAASETFTGTQRMSFYGPKGDIKKPSKPKNTVAIELIDISHI